MNVRRLLTAFLIAVVIAVVLTQTAEAFYMPCFDWWGWYDACWPV